jgi:hypothetical protein
VCWLNACTSSLSAVPELHDAVRRDIVQLGREHLHSVPAASAWIFTELTTAPFPRVVDPTPLKRVFDACATTAFGPGQQDAAECRVKWVDKLTDRGQHARRTVELATVTRLQCQDCGELTLRQQGAQGLDLLLCGNGCLVRDCFDATFVPTVCDKRCYAPACTDDPAVGKETTHTQSVALRLPPPVLFVSFKRFAFDAGGVRRIGDGVVLQEQELFAFNGIERQYQVMAVVDHLGDRATSGHYTRVRNPPPPLGGGGGSKSGCTRPPCAARAGGSRSTTPRCRSSTRRAAGRATPRTASPTGACRRRRAIAGAAAGSMR